MFDHLLQVLPQFLLACLILAALPGPASVLCLHRTLRDGRAAGLAAVAGNEIGVFGWALAGGAGLSVLLAAGLVLLADRAGAVWRRVAIRERLQRALGAILIALGLELAVDWQ